MAKPMKTLELHYPMIQILIMTNISKRQRDHLKKIRVGIKFSLLLNI